MGHRTSGGETKSRSFEWCARNLENDPRVADGGGTVAGVVHIPRRKRRAQY